MAKILLAVFLGLFAVAHAGTNWAVLVAGSDSYYNYRHQSDVCHAYQVLKANGFPDSNIIVMMKDDIANNPSNPVKGNIINVPNGPNVYPGVPKDYTGDAVTPENFLAVLSGDKASVKGGSGKVVQSTADDNIFVFFTDHGAPGLIAFPSKYLYADDMMKTLKSMSAAKKYKQLLFYLEACESGSMFSGKLAADLNIYATTAANPDQSSYACYYDSQRGTYLADLYSVNWMVDTENVHTQGTIHDQFVRVHNATAQSEVCQYGDVSISKELLQQFLVFPGAKPAAKKVNVPRPTKDDMVNTRDIELVTIQKRMEHAKTPAEKARYQAQYKQAYEARKSQDAKMSAMMSAIFNDENKGKMLFNTVVNRLYSSNSASCKTNIPDDASTNDVADFFRQTRQDCLRQSLEGVEAACGRLTEHGMRYISVISEMCEVGVAVEKIVKAAMDVCANGGW